MKAFSQVAGQERVAEFLQEALQAKKLSSTLLFVGPDIEAQIKMAVSVLQVLVCEKQMGCGVCPSCTRVARRESESLFEIQPQGASIKMEQIRQLMREISLQNAARARAVIFHSANLMTAQSANALLKTLEEAPQNTFFVLLTPTLSSVLPTIRSRSQIVFFNDLTRKTSSEFWQSEEMQKIRRAGVDFFLNPSRLEGLSGLSDYLGSREDSLLLVRFWLDWLRDGLYLKNGLKNQIHSDLNSDLEVFVKKYGSQIERLSQSTIELEKLILQNADYNLALESFARNEVYV